MSPISLAGLNGGTLAYAVLVILVAAVVRGYTGFGSSAIMVTGLSLVMPPAEVVPIALILEIVASVGLALHVWHAVDWRLLRWLSAGAVLGMPLGLALLAHLSADRMRVVISILVLGASLLIWFGYRAHGRPGGAHIFSTGIASGLANGIAAVGGLPVVLFLLSTATGAAVSRATLIVYFLFTDLYGAGVAAVNGLVNSEVALRAALFTVPLAAGLIVGHRQFQKTSPDSFRRFTLLLLMALASLGLIRGLLA